MADVVRMKVKCFKIEEYVGSHWDAEKQAHVPAVLYTYRFNFVSGKESPENERFWEASPNGDFWIGTIHEKLFMLGDSYYLDAKPAPA